MKLHESLDRAQGHLETLEKHQIDQLDFDWEGIRFHANVSARAGGGSRITLDATLGRIYYTIEDENQRAIAIDRVFSTNRGIDGAYSIARDGQVNFHSVTDTDKELSGSDVMGALTLILLESESHLRGLRAHLKPVH